VKQLRADLHIHSVLSPCAAAEMTPAAIVREAVNRGLDMIAICDHNAAANAGATQRAAHASIAVFAGIEISTREEAHILGIFPSAEAAEQVAAVVRETLPELKNPPKWMGPQRIMSAGNRTLGRETRMLSAASDYSLTRAVALIHEHGGLAIAAHVDRPSFSVTSQLGMLPDDVAWDAIEVSAAAVARSQTEGFVHYGLPLLASSDSHSLDEIGCCSTLFEVAEASFAELQLALLGRDGRRCSVA
jgi:3',5'-nucleoside bisphosphate phosphatase